jgi:anti-sigma regulatory factor (Ser/Thr protein kinase)
MVLPIRTVTRSGREICFGEKVDDKAVRDFVPTLYDTINRGNRDIVLDFRRSERAYPDAVLPIICLLDHRRSRGDVFHVLLPESDYLRQLFLNANWAHFMDNSHARLNIEHPRHLSARRYATHPEQQDAVESVLDIVLRNMSLSRDVIKALEWSINEVTDNVLNHALSPLGGLVQVSTFRDEHKIKFVVADAGRGIPTAMRDAFPRIGDDAKAIGEAVKAGVTSIPESGQGNGLAGTLRIAKCAGGSFKIASGRAQLSVFRDQRTSRWNERKTRPRSGFEFPGTVVMMELSTNVEFDIEQALDLGGIAPGGVSDVIDLKYAGESGELVLRVADERRGVGTRHAGVELRQKCVNLLNAEPTRRLVLDWSGIEMISSSFADEAVGKLFVDLGPTMFASRVGHAGTDPLVRSLLDRAVTQRLVHAAQAQREPHEGSG